MLMPKRVKHRKQFRGSMKGKATSNNKIAYGDYALVATEPGWITTNQIEAVRVAANRCMKRQGKLWLKIFPHKPITKKPLGVRMGGGKGQPEQWVAVVRPGNLIVEIGGVSEEVAKEALRLASHKLPVLTKIIKREDNENLQEGGRA